MEATSSARGFGRVVVLVACFVASAGFVPTAAPRSGLSLQASVEPAGGMAALQRKAKEAEATKFREGLASGDPVLAALEAAPEGSLDGRSREGYGQVFQQLKRVKRGALKVVAEYHKSVPAALRANGIQEYEIPDPFLVSSEVRGAGASVLALNMDRVGGGCDGGDFEIALKEQQSAKGDFPGPLPIVWMDTVVDEVQLAQAYAAGAQAVTLGLETLGSDKCLALRKLAEDVYGLEAVVVCAPRATGATGLRELLASAVDDVGASLILVGGVDYATAAEARAFVTADDVVVIARVDAKDDQGLEEAEEAWHIRDAGYDAVWISDVLYKFGVFSGTLFASSPDTITSVIKAVKSKASVKYARASGAFSGKGEGAKEYLGDIMM